MGFLSALSVFASIALAALANGSPLTSPVKRELASQNLQDVKLRYVTDSGICETTPGVHQMSGYIDVGTNMSMWFWFFEARKSPETAPFTLWLNGGPGCSSMIGLFRENGPCQVNEDLTTTLNPYRQVHLTTFTSDMIFIDQPIGTGFSYGTDNVNSTDAAAPFVWTTFQILFESPEFSKFQKREFIFGSESYGGHYGPSFVTFFDQQNARIQSGEIKGEEINVSALMINKYVVSSHHCMSYRPDEPTTSPFHQFLGIALFSGWYDPIIQNKAYLDFAINAPGYGQLAPDDVLATMNDSYFRPGGCLEQEQACYDAGSGPESDSICKAADDFCIENLFTPAVGDRDPDDLRQNSSALFPSSNYANYLLQQAVMNAIGAEVEYLECSEAAFDVFTRTGDDARTVLPQLGNLANSGLKILTWAGDADINCNWLGGHASVLAMDWYGKERLGNTSFANMTINGKVVAAIKNVDNFSFARVYDSGHEVPAYQPEAAFEVFRQVVNMQQLHSV
ncbi:hypothetical protein D9758_011146 [Tetrapyrgos nigripes]|uniref:Carboxypeptidase n=1 Tax=Tetrapyrgos nigripes TaxID=182062 RepID=A0A8H5CJU8_9AGAR|nr:hypothetical protein D9758_011146 [Tetrapyrgos nigripes]